MNDPRIAALAEALAAVKIDRFNSDEEWAAAILAALPPDWCGNDEEAMLENDRDRLAADLHDADCKANRLYCDGQRCEDIADRLIALGWTRLDEERLARALIPVLQPVMDDLGIPNYRGEWTNAVAALLAKAYREDTRSPRCGPNTHSAP